MPDILITAPPESVILALTNEVVRLQGVVRDLEAALEPRCLEEPPPNTPKAGETWHVLHPGARACCTLKVVEVTERTVLLDSMVLGRPRERLPLGGGLVFLERVVRGDGAKTQP